jgi:hypothetical protein
VLEDFLKIHQRRFEEEPVARRVVDANRAVHVAPIGDVNEDDAGRLAVFAVEAIDVAAAILEPGVKAALVAISPGVGGDQRLGDAALGTVLGEENLALALHTIGGNNFLARIAQRSIHCLSPKCIPRNTDGQKNVRSSLRSVHPSPFGLFRGKNRTV